MQRTITFIVHPGFELLDLSGPCSAFNLARENHGAQYDIQIASINGGLVQDRAGVVVQSLPLAGLGGSHSLIATGGPLAPQFALTPAARQSMQALSQTATRLGSVCTGTFLLAAAGLLDGRRATTHWRYAPLLQQQYPAITVDADHIFIRDGHCWTSAGMTAGMDMALAMIQDDYGPQIAQDIARDMVLQQRRLGGQSQFSSMLQLVLSPGRIQDALHYARQHLHESLSVEHLAQIACLSLRQFNRAFRSATGTTPAKAIAQMRLEQARPRIEQSNDSFDLIARTFGFNNEETLRRHCLASYGLPPQELRRRARQGL